MVSKERLQTALRDSLDESGRQWLGDALARVQTGSLDDLLAVYTAASRRIGGGPLPVPAGAPPAGRDFDGWTLEDAARALLLLTRQEASGPTFRDDAIACYELGDAREQRSWLRAVAALPDPEQFLPLAIDSCRSSMATIFEAIACENPYPSRYFPERNFNQMVLKALFSGVALSRVVGLEGRLNAELTRMASDYADERRAAGRSVPVDIGMAMQDRARQQEQPR